MMRWAGVGEWGVVEGGVLSNSIIEQASPLIIDSCVAGVGGKDLEPPHRAMATPMQLNQDRPSFPKSDNWGRLTL